MRGRFLSDKRKSLACNAHFDYNQSMDCMQGLSYPAKQFHSAHQKMSDVAQFITPEIAPEEGAIKR
jgi:hypothetical protein